MLKWFSKQKTAESSVNNQSQEKEDVPEVSNSSHLTDADYDFLFNQLLDGVAHGWNQFKIIKFFQNLGLRGEEAHWVTWLEKLSAKIPDATNDSQRRVGAIMLRLAEVTQSAAELSQISAVSAQMGKKLFFGKVADLIWEYDGVDVVSPIDNSSGEDNNDSIEENITLKEDSEPSPQPAVEESLPPENIESFPPEELTPAISESNLLEIPEEQVIETKPPEKHNNIVPPTTEQVESRTKDMLDTTVMELVESWFNLGLKQANAGDLPGAIDSWQKALQLNPNLAEIWHNLGSALGRLEYYAEAIDSFNHALEIDPQSDQAWNDRAHAFYQMEQWEQAIDSWLKAIAINPGNHQFWYHHGNALEQLQRLDEAIASYEKALEISPDFQPARSKYVNLRTEQQ